MMLPRRFRFFFASPRYAIIIAISYAIDFDAAMPLRHAFI